MNVIRNLLTLEIYYETFGTNELVWPILGQCSYFIRPENSKKNNGYHEVVNHSSRVAVQEKDIGTMCEVC